VLHDLALIAKWCSKPILARRFERRRDLLRIDDSIPRAPIPIAPREDPMEQLQTASDGAGGPTLPTSRSN
jgi:hypothetical protein